jgi:halimadienyl-diphosphate synthase
MDVDTKSLVTELGKGLVLPVAYDTAWLARVPDFPDVHKPAFPAALIWLRKHQLADGQWGTNFPQHGHDNTLSTLAAILALAQWQDPADFPLIKAGLNSLKISATMLEQEPHETIAFELLLPALIEECESLGLMIPAEASLCYTHYKKMSAEKRKLIALQQEKYGYAQPASWWFSLELLGGIAMRDRSIDLGLKESMLSANGSIAASPAATAYFLAALRLRGKDAPQALHYLQQNPQCAEQSAMPNVFPINEFELAFSVNYLLEAGFPPSDPYLQRAIAQIIKVWEQRQKGGLGYTSYFFIDPDGSANGMRVLATAGYKNLNPDVLLDFFNGTYIENFKNERSFSISANLHVISALRLLKPTPEIDHAIKSILAWLETQTHASTVFTDKWHASAIYPNARAVLALMGLHDTLAKRCVDWLVAHQHQDGGWGMFGSSTAEETAFASLALACWQQQKHEIDHEVLTKANHFLNAITTWPTTPLWIGKVLYCPYYVVATLIIAARFALTQALLTSKASIKPCTI